MLGNAIGPVQPLDVVIRNIARSRWIRQRNSGWRLGCLRQSGGRSQRSARRCDLSATSKFIFKFKRNIQSIRFACLFLALEESNSACSRTGWGPRHLIARQNGAIVGLVPCYLKSNSQGEYVFDHGWANAYESAGGRYYPKLLASRSVYAGYRSAASDLPRQRP